MHSDLLLVLVVGTALAFDFTNGFHDTANVVATSISTRALPPRVAIGMASLLNFAGAFISLAVAATVAKGIVDPSVVALQPAIVFSGLIGAISWNVVTWYYGLPSSSSHALIGGVVGAAFAANGSSGVMGDGLVGKIESATHGTAQVTLITDASSAVSAQIMPDGSSGILRWGGSGRGRWAPGSGSAR